MLEFDARAPIRHARSCRLGLLSSAIFRARAATRMHSSTFGGGTLHFAGGRAEHGVGVRAIVLARALSAQSGGDAGLARGRVRLRRVQRGGGRGGAHKPEVVVIVVAMFGGRR